jgi:hypothetical protein
MRELGNDILLFNKILPNSIIDELNQLVDDNYETIFNRELRYATFPFEGIRGRVELYKYESLYNKFNKFWFDIIENQMLDYYFKFLDNKEQIDGYKEHVKTDWKDMFIQVYNELNTFEINDNVHCDFSGITFVACIGDDYEGGYLEFPKQEVSIKLSTGDLILFPGSYTHPHGVTKLTNGERRVLVGQSMGVKQLHKFGKEI